MFGFGALHVIGTFVANHLFMSGCLFLPVGLILFLLMVAFLDEPIMEYEIVFPLYNFGRNV